MTVRHFRDLAVYGEQLLLSIRYGDWIDVNDEDSAKNWARYFRAEIQGYLHSYRAVTGIDLTNPDTVDATIPGILLQKRRWRRSNRGRGRRRNAEFACSTSRSALYLGFEHGSGSLPGWERLTLGKPAALEDVPGTLQVQRELAALTGCEQVVLGASTLHLFNDLFGMLAGRNDVAIWIDEAAYPIARWGADRAAACGVPVRVFASHDAQALWKAMNANRKARPVIVTDGFCPIRGEPAPLADYARCAAAGNGLLIVDDTQALGVFGRRGAGDPYGSGGGGSIRRFSLEVLRESLWSVRWRRRWACRWRCSAAAGVCGRVSWEEHDAGSLQSSFGRNGSCGKAGTRIESAMG